MDGMFEKSEKRVYTIYKIIDFVDKKLSDYKPNKDSSIYKEIVEGFKNAMDDDFNMALVLSNLISKINVLLNMTNKKSESQNLVDAVYAIKEVYSVLGLFKKNPVLVINNIKNKYLTISGLTEEAIISLIEQRKNYKSEGNYEQADIIRNKLQEQGIDTKDSREGTTWDIIIPPSKILKK